MKPERSLRPLWWLFFCTGLSGLLLEQSFERWLSTVVGASRQSGAIVLALYFVGLAIGAWLFTPMSRRIRNGIRLYALLEGVVGLYAIVLGFFPEPILMGSTRLLAAIPADSAGSIAVRVLIGAMWILPPTLAMGATFPAVVRALEQSRGGQQLASRMSSLYAANLLGAVTAALLAPYLFFAYLGVDGTVQSVIVIQAIIVCMALWLARSREKAGTDEGSDPPLASVDSGPHRRSSPVVALAFFSGLTVFAFEVAWIHLIGAAIGMSAFSFSLMLVCVLLGLGLASVFVSRIRAKEKTLPNRALGYAFLAAAITALVSHLLWDRASHILLMFGGGATGFYQGELARLLTAMVILLPCSTMLGMIYPLLFRIEFFPQERAAAVSSQMTMANALGSMIGALGTGFILLNSIGAENTLRGLGVMLALVAIVPLLPWQQKNQARSPQGAKLPRRALVAVCLAAGLVIVPFAMPSWNYASLLSGINVYFRPGHALPTDEIVFLGEDNVGGYTAVVKRVSAADQSVMHTLLTNGKFQGNDTGEVMAQIAFAYLPAAYAKGRQRALVIGLGTGASASTIDAAGFESVEVAELSPTIAKAAKLFSHINRNLFDLPGVRLYVEDGRTHLARHLSGTYDLMSLELSSVWFAGSTNLYSYEFCRLASDRLKKDGVFQQWVQLHHIGTNELVSIVATLRAAFEYVQLHFVGGQGILLASAAPLNLDEDHANAVARKIADAFKDIAATRPVLGAGLLRSTLVLDADDSTRLLQYVKDSGLTLNDDKNRYLEYWSPRFNLEQRDLVPVNLMFLLRFVDPEESAPRARAFGLRIPPKN